MPRYEVQTTYDGQWSNEVGDGNVFASKEEADEAIAGLKILGDDWLGAEYRVEEIQKDEGPVCEISQTFGYPDADEANARLIAAAPELLAIVQHLADAQRDGAQGVYFGALFGDDDITTLGDAVTAAIAKAEEG